MKPSLYQFLLPISLTHSSANEADPLRPHLQAVVAAAQAPRHTPPQLPPCHLGNSLAIQSQSPPLRTRESAMATWKPFVSSRPIT